MKMYLCIILARKIMEFPRAQTLILLTFLNTRDVMTTLTRQAQLWLSLYRWGDCAQAQAAPPGSMASKQLSLGGESSRPSDLAPVIPTTPKLLRLQGKNVVNRQRGKRQLRTWDVQAGGGAGALVPSASSMTDSASVAPSGLETLKSPPWPFIWQVLHAERLLGRETELQGRRFSSALADPNQYINLHSPWKTEIRTHAWKAHFTHLFLQPTNNFLTAYWVSGPVPNTNYTLK